MRARRLLSLLLLLQGRRDPVTAEALAVELGVSVRTVHRDLETLGAAGIPVYGMRGPGGGCGVLGGYRTSLTGLTQPEAEAVLLAGLAGPAAELGLGAALAAAERKVLAALPEPLRTAAALARQRFHLDARGWFAAPGETPALEAVAAAVWNDRRLAIRYARGDGRSVQRSVDALALALKAGAWYLVGRIGGEPRVYRIERIREALPTGEGFTRDPEFDLARFWASWTAGFEAGLHFETVLVRLSPAGEGRAKELGDALARAPAEPAPVREAGGWMRRPLVFERPEWAEAALLRLGADVEVLAPPALRARLAAQARGLAALYASAPPTPGGSGPPRSRSARRPARGPAHGRRGGRGPGPRPRSPPP